MTREEFAESAAYRATSDRRERRTAERAEKLRAEQAAHPGQFRVPHPLNAWSPIRDYFWIPRWIVPVGAIVLIGTIVLARRG